MVKSVEFERPILMIDVVLLTLRRDVLHVGLLRRDITPAASQLALVGGYVHADEDVDTLATATRVLREKCKLEGIYCEQLMTFSGRQRDPRGWSATVAYYALLPEDMPRSLNLVFVPADEPGVLPFDHNQIVAVALERVRAKASYSTLPAFMLPPSFTLSQLRSVYERIMGAAINDSAFRRKIDELDILEPVAGATSKLSARPAQLFRLKGEVLRAFDRRI
jgi:8-oxo-dGTP diphosphatase